MGVGNGGKRGKTVILRFAIVDLTTVILNCPLGVLELLSSEWCETER